MGSLKVKGWKKIRHANIDYRKSGVAIYISISGKTDLRTIKVAKDRKGHYMIIKGSIHQEW